MNDDRKLDLLVTYARNCEELKESNAKRSETVASLKTRVLSAFGLNEGDEHGKLTTYSLFNDDHELNPERTLGDVAGDRELLKLELARERYFFWYKEDHRIRSELEVATGAQIKAMIKAVVPTFDLQHELILEGHGHHPDKVISDIEPVSLEVGEGHPVKHFFSKPPTSFGA